MHNTLTDVVVGIDASGYYISIFENTISWCDRG